MKSCPGKTEMWHPDWKQQAHKLVWSCDVNTRIHIISNNADYSEANLRLENSRDFRFEYEMKSNEDEIIFNEWPNEHNQICISV